MTSENQTKPTTDPGAAAVQLDRSAPVCYVKLYPQAKKGQRVDVTKRVISLEFDDDERKMNLLEMTVDNYDLSLFDDPLWKSGNLIETAWGYAGNLCPAREMVITKITGFMQLKIHALAKSVLMNKKPRSRTFDNMTRTDVIKQIAKENGYGDDLQIIEDTKHKIPHITQANLTDAQFMMSLANREGFQFFVDFDGLHFHRRQVGKRPLRTYRYFTDPGQGDMLNVNIENDVTIKPGAVNAKGRDPLKKKDINVTSDDGSTDRSVTAPVIEIIDPRTGVSTIQPNVGAEATIVTTAPDEKTAKRESDGRFIKAQQTTVILTFDAIGDPRVKAKEVIECTGLGKRLSGRYHVVGVKHKVTAESFTQSFYTRTDGTNGTQGLKNKRTDGKLNNLDPNGDLIPVEKVDPRTGVTKIEYQKYDPTTNKS